MLVLAPMMAGIGWAGSRGDPVILATTAMQPAHSGFSPHTPRSLVQGQVLAAVGQKARASIELGQGSVPDHRGSEGRWKEGERETWGRENGWEEDGKRDTETGSMGETHNPLALQGHLGLNWPGHSSDHSGATPHPCLGKQLHWLSQCRFIGLGSPQISPLDCP